jgi:NhaP-type Na+/H+ or K+/H+ antiporter
MAYMEASVMFVFAYISFVGPEIVHWSGIVSALTAAMFMSTYAKVNISNEGKQLCSYLFKTMAVCAETLIFLMVGMNILLFDIDENFDSAFFFYTVFLILACRALNSFGLTTLSNFLREPKKRISIGSQVVMWNAGLRGAIAFALAVEFPNANKHQFLIINTTMAIIILTIFGHGGATVPLLKLFKLRAVDQDAAFKPHNAEEMPTTPKSGIDPGASERELSMSFETNVDEAPVNTDYDRTEQKKRVRELYSGFAWFDNSYIRPILCRPKAVQVEINLDEASDLTPEQEQQQSGRTMQKAEPLEEKDVELTMPTSESGEVSQSAVLGSK